MTDSPYMMRHQPPVVGASTWLEVIARADYRCQCTGQCGSGHVRDAGRCPHEVSVYQLAAAPADPAISGVAACRVNAAQLMAWCGPCLEDTIRAVRRRAAANAADAGDQLALLDVTPATKAAGWSA
jgi:hypothetical protein